MDTLTHALSGVLVLRAGHRRLDRRQLIAVAAAAALPDLDYLLILIDPLAFLNLHRGPTHSLLLLPLWAALAALPLGRLLGIAWRRCVVLCALGLAVHILGDWVTLYGTKLWYPLSDRAYALRASFDFNPWIAGVTILGLLLARTWGARRSARVSLALIAALLTAQYWLGTQARQLAERQVTQTGAEAARVQALPQPLSPFHWALVVADDDGYAMAYLDLLGLTYAGPTRSQLLGGLATYRPLEDLTWTRYRRPDDTALSAEAWAQPRFAAFRRFAPLPALLQIDHAGDGVCVWFTDLRHRLPSLPAAFRYGLCRAHSDAPWRPFRLRYFTAGDRQAL